MKFCKSITVNMGNYQTMKIEVIEAETFEQADQQLVNEIKRLNILNFQHAGVKQ